jgi:hypothetical protein
MTQPFDCFDDLKLAHPSAVAFDFWIPYLRGMAALWWHPLSYHVNATDFEGYPPGTVLFAGGLAKSENRFIKLNFAHCDEGWNTQFDAASNSWIQSIQFNVADLSPLAKQKVDVTKGYGKDFVAQPVR